MGTKSLFSNLQQAVKTAGSLKRSGTHDHGQNGQNHVNRGLARLHMEAEHQYDQTDTGDQREAAAAIVHEGRRLEALSRKLLALLGLNEEGVELTAVPLPALWPRLHAACPDVSLRTPAAAPTVRGDADLLLDLLCNLVQNAAKASAPGAPVLVLCAQAGDAVTLTVADRGCGIPPELIPRVTEPFYMVDKSRARRQGGSGLGLALCQRIAAAHGSALRIESEPGRGTRVSVTLPVWKEDAP